MVILTQSLALNLLFEQEVVAFNEKKLITLRAAGGFNKGYLVVASLHAKLLARVNTYASAA